jgi:hypothetical protein
MYHENPPKRDHPHPDEALFAAPQARHLTKSTFWVKFDHMLSLISHFEFRVSKPAEVLRAAPTIALNLIVCATRHYTIGASLKKS